MNLKDRRGQGLIEYLIIVALMAVATMGVVRALSYAVQTRFANTIYAIHGVNKKVRTETFDESQIKKKDLSDFMNGAAQESK